MNYLKDIIFHVDMGSCLDVLKSRLNDDKDNDLDGHTAEVAVRKAISEGYLAGKDEWLKVTKHGWDWWGKNK